VDVDVHASLAQVLGISNPWVERFLELSVDLAAVADGEDEHHEHVVVDLIGDAVVAGTERMVQIPRSS
jgi:ABC-type microcin C transport system permease subunit YejB